MKIREVPRDNFIHQASCGLFGVSEDFLEEYQSLDERFIKNKTSTFFFQAVGDSMIPTIFPGEYLVVDRSIDQFHGRVCVVTYNGELLCKRVFKTREGLLLKSDNNRFKDIIVRESFETSLWGVVIAKCGDVS
jgi:DNA polymerase V